MTDAFRFFLECINLFFIIYLIGYSSFLFLSVVTGAIELYKSYRLEQLHNKLWQSYYIPVSILVPAYNEEVTVKDTVTSLLNLDYKLYEIIVIDDGSKDKTSQVLIDAFHMERVERPIRHLIQCQPEEEVYECPNQKVPITLIRKKNGGKADSLNAGINAVRYPWFICMDADSVLQHDSLEKIVRPVLEDENVIAVGGSVRPANGVVIKKGHVIKYRLPRNIIARMQSLEYDRSFLAARILLDKINANMIISGAFGLFEKKTVIAVGGYDNSTMGEETVVLLSHKKPDGHINVKVEFGEGEGKVPLDNIAKRAEEYKPKERVTYKMIKEYIEAKYGFKVHTAYIAEVKRDLGLPMYDAPNAVEKLKQPRKHPTPEKVEAIKDALKHFEVI